MQVHVTEIKAPKGTIAQTCQRERAVSWDLTARRSLRAVLGPPASPASRSLQQMGCSRRLSPPSHGTSRYASAPELVALDLGFLLLWEGLRAACRASPRAKPWRAAHAETLGRLRLGEAAKSRTRCTTCALCGHLSWKDSHCTASSSLPRDLASFTAGCS